MHEISTKFLSRTFLLEDIPTLISKVPYRFSNLFFFLKKIRQFSINRLKGRSELHLPSAREVCKLQLLLSVYYVAPKELVLLKLPLVGVPKYQLPVE